MNTVGLSQRLGSRLAVADTADLPADVAIDVLEAINAALSRVYAVLPDAYKQTTVSATFQSPVSALLTFASVPSRNAVGTPFADRHGCTVVIPGMQPNQALTDSGLLDLYVGPSLSAAAIIYHDAQMINDTIERIAGDVWMSYIGGSRKQLTPHDTAKYTENRYYSEFGEPRHYSIEPLGISQGAEPEMLLRLYPAPVRVCNVRFNAEMAPRRVIFADLIDPAKIPLPTSMIETILLPVAAGHMAQHSAFWRDPRSIAGTIDAAGAALAQVSLQPTHFRTQYNTVGAPRGF